jgi:hypothetical protein
MPATVLAEGDDGEAVALEDLLDGEFVAEEGWLAVGVFAVPPPLPALVAMAIVEMAAFVPLTDP